MARSAPVRRGDVPTPSAERIAVINRLGVSRETTERLDALMYMLARWSGAINLVAPASLPYSWTRHVLDSAQLLDLAPDGARTWLDIGAGGGFPGLVIAALAAERRPDLAVTLMESDSRKCAFLLAAAQTMGVSISVERRRIEVGPPVPSDIVSARAVAPLPALLDLAERHIARGGMAIFPKGVAVEDELLVASQLWRYRIQRSPSVTDAGATILVMGDISRVGAA